MSAVLNAHVERELAIMDSVGAMDSVGTIDEAASLIATVIESLASAESLHLTTARYEIYLEGLRQEPFQVLIAQVRTRFLAIGVGLLNDLNLPSDDYIATGLVSLVEGLTANQVFHSGAALNKKDLKALITAFLNSLKTI
ncbi:MAG: hypothetical protein F2799_04750 [Actinobacteria bacterium]|nr:hypothetical protein [Actinomycetota bacterium]